jgi:hypothetical protein
MAHRAGCHEVLQLFFTLPLRGRDQVDELEAEKR